MKKKKYGLAAGIFLLMILAGCGGKDKNANTNPEDKEVSVEILDNEQLTLTYTGYGKEEEGLLFTISNKTSETINVYFQDVAIDGKTIEPLFGMDIGPKTEEKEVCLVECDSVLPVLEGILAIDNAEGENIAQFAIKNQALTEEKTENTDASYQLKDGAVQVLDNENMTIAYTGIDDEEPGLIFEVYNKTDEMFQVSFDTILVNDEEEEPSYVADTLSHTYSELVCDVTEPEAVTTLTATLTIYDVDDNKIASYSIENVPMK